MLWYDQGEDSDADADDTIKPPWSDGEIVKIAFGAESCGHELYPDFTNWTRFLRFSGRLIATSH